jgi:hypothetical protein
MRLIEKFKRDVLRSRQKTAVLGVLVVTMAVLGVRAVFELQPRQADASTKEPGEAVGPSQDTPMVEANPEERIRQSKELWRLLREKHGTDASVAFSFDASFFTLDPNRRITASPERVEATPLGNPNEDVETTRRSRTAAIRDQSRTLNVKSTTVGSGKPWAIVNQVLVSVGDKIEGFEITAIRSREVEFRKEGVTIAVKMPDDLRGQ